MQKWQPRLSGGTLAGTEDVSLVVERHPSGAFRFASQGNYMNGYRVDRWLTVSPSWESRHG